MQTENMYIAEDLRGGPFCQFANVHHNLGAAALLERAIINREGVLAENGAFAVRTGVHTGRSPKDKFVVAEPTSERHVWWGPVNRPMREDHFESLYQRIISYLKGKDVFVQDCHVGAHPAYRMPIRVITEDAWHSLFARQLFIPQSQPAEKYFNPEFTVINVPGFNAVPEEDGTRSETFIVLNFARKLVLIGGTAYAGEIKKSMFTVMNYLLPQRGVMTMHAAANVGANGRSAVFFGLSGTGKTSLSADPERSLIGDDEIAWSNEGLFNIEGGCYAKCIRLSKPDEPVIYDAIRFGSILENVVIDEETHVLDYNSDAITENTRACYPLKFVKNAISPSLAAAPRNVIFLTCDAFGVLPPISKLTPEQAMYHFISGYSAKVAGTEAGIKEPQATFSACFGAPFMALHPTVYANLLKEKMAEHGTLCWLVNTGWTGGPYGVGKRIGIHHTRAMIKAALNGELQYVETQTDEIFNLAVPSTCPNVPQALLWPRNTWKDREAYDLKARELRQQFEKNYEKCTRKEGLC